jgi:hypothetical protein
MSFLNARLSNDNTIEGAPILNNTFFMLGNRIIYAHQFPYPSVYYQQQFPDLKSIGKEWTSVKCCFHEDRQPSLRLNLKNGISLLWCDARGGNIMAFHCQRYQLRLIQTVMALGGAL